MDRLPLAICKLERSKHSSICKKQAYSFPDKGNYAKQNTHFYGHKLHAACSVNGVFQSVDLSPASVCHIHYLKEIQSQLPNCALIGYKGYLSSEIQLSLFETGNIQLKNAQKKKDCNPQFYPFKKKRKRIKTLSSQFYDQFMIRRNYAKTFSGFKTRILSKITALTIFQYINKVIFDRNINNLEININ